MLILTLTMMFLLLVHEYTISMDLDVEMKDFEHLTKFISEEGFPNLLNIKVVTYFLIAVCCFGGAGVWVPWLDTSADVIYLSGSNVFTFSFALLGSLLCEKLFFDKEGLKAKVDEAVKRNNLDEMWDNQNISDKLYSWGMFFGAGNAMLAMLAYNFYPNETSLFNIITLVYTLVFFFFATSGYVKERAGDGKEKELSKIIDAELSKNKSEPGMGI